MKNVCMHIFLLNELSPFFRHRIFETRVIQINIKTGHAFIIIIIIIIIIIF